MNNKVTWVMVDEPYTKEDVLYVDCEAFMIIDAKYYSTNGTVALSAPIEYTDPRGLDITDTVEAILSADKLASIKDAIESHISELENK